MPQPKTVGLGEGTVTRENGTWKFYPVDQGIDTLPGRTVGLDTFVTIDGEPLQHGSRENLRPFNGEELQRILRVGLCLECHEDIRDGLREYDPAGPCPCRAVRPVTRTEDDDEKYLRGYSGWQALPGLLWRIAPTCPDGEQIRNLDPIATRTAPGRRMQLESHTARPLSFPQDTLILPNQLNHVQQKR